MTIKKIVEIYVTSSDKKPFIEWLESLDDKIRYRVKERLDRVLLGNLGDNKFIKNGVFELRLDFGSGYRIYFGNEKKFFIVLRCGGNKSTQNKDIKKALEYWKDYLSR